MKIIHHIIRDKDSSFFILIVMMVMIISREEYATINVTIAFNKC